MSDDNTREIITICVGQGGVQLGNKVWDQYLTEHDISREGKSEKEQVSKSYQTFFEETGANLTPRCVYVDLEETTIDCVKSGTLSKLFNTNMLVSGKEDAANNFARGHYTVGKEKMDMINDRIRKLLDSSTNPQGFIVTHSVGGGTGSGLGMLILERLAVDHRKKSKIGFEIYPSPKIATSIVEPYNALLSTHWLLDHTDVSLMLDNEACYQICVDKLKVKQPNYENLNRLICKVISSMTASLRFKGELNVDMNEFQTNLVPFPRLHFMTTSIAPLNPAKDEDSKNSVTCKSITSKVADPKNFLIKYEDFDIVEDKYMAISLAYRGNIESKTANATVQWMKKENKVSFVEWCPTGFKIGLNDVPAKFVEGDDLKEETSQVVMIGNNIAVNRVFSERIAKKYDMMYSQRAYVHWYVGEGMEEGEFSEAREDIGFLEKDYLDVVTEQASDENEEEEF